MHIEIYWSQLSTRNSMFPRQIPCAGHDKCDIIALCINNGS